MPTDYIPPAHASPINENLRWECFSSGAFLHASLSAPTLTRELRHESRQLALHFHGNRVRRRFMAGDLLWINADSAAKSGRFVGIDAINRFIRLCWTGPAARNHRAIR